MFLSEVEALCFQITKWVGGWLDDCVYRNVFFIRWYLGKYSRSEVETLHVSTVWWEIDARPWSRPWSGSRSPLSGPWSGNRNPGSGPWSWSRNPGSGPWSGSKNRGFASWSELPPNGLYSDLQMLQKPCSGHQWWRNLACIVLVIL